MNTVDVEAATDDVLKILSKHVPELNVFSASLGYLAMCMVLEAKRLQEVSENIVDETRILVSRRITHADGTYGTLPDTCIATAVECGAVTLVSETVSMDDARTICRTTLMGYDTLTLRTSCGCVVEHRRKM